MTKRRIEFLTILWLLSLCVLYIFIKHIHFISRGHLGDHIFGRREKGHGKAIFSSLRQPQSNIQDLMRMSGFMNYSATFQMWAMQLGPEVNEECRDDNRRIIVRGRQYGQFSNMLISLAHGIGLTEALNRHYHELGDKTRYSLVLPNYLHRALHPFDLTLLRSQYCFYTTHTPTRVEHLDQMPSFTLSTLFSRKKSIMNIYLKFTEAFWSVFNFATVNIGLDFEIAKGQEFRSTNPIRRVGDVIETYRRDKGDVYIDSKLLFLWGKKDAIAWRKENFPFLLENNHESEATYYTKIYIAVLSALYGSVRPGVANGVLILHKEMTDRVHQETSAFNYTAAHRRGLDGFCNSVMKIKTISNKDFDSSIGNLTACWYSDEYEEGCSAAGSRMHPLCTMSAAFLKSVHQSEGCSGLPIFLSSDSPTSRNDERWRVNNGNAFFVGRQLRSSLGLSTILSDPEQSCIDILLCSFANGLFVGNPASTFSFQIFTLRTLLRVSSLPYAPFHDIYFDRFDNPDSSSWISQKRIRYLIESLYVF